MEPRSRNKVVGQRNFPETAMGRGPTRFRVQYDDGDVETMKPIKRIKALEESDSDSGED